VTGGYASGGGSAGTGGQGGVRIVYGVPSSQFYSVVP
jgi:hypothetical protein